MKFIVETSARHVHVTEETLKILFGEGHQLTHKKDLSQPGHEAMGLIIDGLFDQNKDGWN